MVFAGVAVPRSHVFLLHAPVWERYATPRANARWKNGTFMYVSRDRQGLSLDSSWLIHWRGRRARAARSARPSARVGKKRTRRKSEIPRMRRRRVAMTLGRVLTRAFRLFVPRQFVGKPLSVVCGFAVIARPTNRRAIILHGLLHGGRSRSRIRYSKA